MIKQKIEDEKTSNLSLKENGQGLAKGFYVNSQEKEPQFHHRRPIYAFNNKLYKEARHEV